MVKVVGVTGGIGAGKSVVSRILRLKGYQVYDCDVEAKIIMDTDDQLKKEISNHIGMNCIRTDGQLNREIIAKAAFSDNDFRAWLNGRVHTLVRKDLREWIEGMEEENHKFCFVESAILSTSELDRMCDRIWIVECDEQLRIERALSRGGIMRDNLLLRIEAQRREFDRLPKEITDIIVNDGSESILNRIDHLIERLYIE